MDHGSRRLDDEHETTQHTGRLIALPLPPREPALDELPERPPAIVLSFPSRRAAHDEPPGGDGMPPRLAV